MKNEIQWPMTSDDSRVVLRCNKFNQQALELCLEYSEEPDKLKTVLSDLTLHVLIIGSEKVPDRTVDMKRLRTRVTITRNKRSISFDYFESHVNAMAYDGYLTRRNGARGGTMQVLAKDFGRSSDNELAKACRQLTKDQEKMRVGMLCSVLACCGSDYFVPSTHGEFCDDYGYDTDSRKALALYLRCQEHSALLRQVFSDDDCEALPS